MSKIIEEALDAVAMNVDGPNLYLKSYDNLLYITNGSAKEKLKEYFNLDPFPSLREFGHKIEDLDALSQKISLFRNKVCI